MLLVVVLKQVEVHVILSRALQLMIQRNFGSQARTCGQPANQQRNSRQNGVRSASSFTCVKRATTRFLPPKIIGCFNKIACRSAWLLFKHINLAIWFVGSFRLPIHSPREFFAHCFSLLFSTHLSLFFSFFKLKLNLRVGSILAVADPVRKAIPT